MESYDVFTAKHRLLESRNHWRLVEKMTWPVTDYSDAVYILL